MPLPANPAELLALATDGPKADTKKVPSSRDLKRTPNGIAYGIHVDATGKFEYTPKVDWVYGRGDSVTYASDTGPFEIEFVLATAGRPASPWRSGETVLTSTTSAPFVTGQQIVRIPTPPSKENLKATYDYKIKVTGKDANGNQKLFHNTGSNSKLGSVEC